MTPDSATKFRVGSQAIAAAITAEQLPAMPIVNGHGLVVKARDTNTSYIYIGYSKATAEAHHFSLAPGGSVIIYVDDLSDIWVDVAVNGEAVEWAAEVRSGVV